MTYRLLIDAANGCDDQGDTEFRDALARVASRVLKAKSTGETSLLSAGTEQSTADDLRLCTS